MIQLKLKIKFEILNMKMKKKRINQAKIKKNLQNKLFIKKINIIFKKLRYFVILNSLIIIEFSHFPLFIFLWFD